MLPAALALGDGTPARDDPGPLVHVELVGGQVFSGQIAPQTDEHQLLLRWPGRHGGQVLRWLDWRHLARVEIDGQVIAAADLERFVAAVRREHPKPPADLAVPPSLAARCAADSAPLVAAVPDAARVRSLRVTAELANWDADPEHDGLMLLVAPLDAAGRLVPAGGTVEAALVGLRVGSGRESGLPGQIGRWVCRLTPDEFGPLGATCRLEFQAAQPDIERRFAVIARLSVRLSVAGQGVFEALPRDVRIRPYSAVLDRLEQARVIRNWGSGIRD